MKKDARSSIVGDHKQMPPIPAARTPKGAEHLVGSIQDYLIRRFNIGTCPCCSITGPIKILSNMPFAGLSGKAAACLSGTGSAAAAVRRVRHQGHAGRPAGHRRYRGAAETGAARPPRSCHEDVTSSQANEVEAGRWRASPMSPAWSSQRKLDEGKPTAKTAYSEDEFFESGIGIVTPHKAQKALVVRKLLALFPRRTRRRFLNPSIQ